jgi:uncharacterized protein
MKLARGSSIVLASLLASCASTTPRFYTLVPEAERASSATGAAGFRVQVDPVSIPAQVDRLELVVRLPDGGVVVAEGERWIAPVADELQSALSVELLHRLGGVPPTGASGLDSLSVRLNVERFESSPNRYALIEASWHLELKEAGRDLKVVCRTRAYERVRGAYPEMIRGYQRDIGLIAEQIATVAQGSVGGEAAQCPVRGIDR